jgi:hypothetical protein
MAQPQLTGLDRVQPPIAVAGPPGQQGGGHPAERLGGVQRVGVAVEELGGERRASDLRPQAKPTVGVDGRCRPAGRTVGRVEGHPPQQSLDQRHADACALDGPQGVGQRSRARRRVAGHEDDVLGTRVKCPPVGRHPRIEDPHRLQSRLERRPHLGGDALVEVDEAPERRAGSVLARRAAQGARGRRLVVLGLQAPAPGGQRGGLGPQRVALGQQRRPLAGQGVRACSGGRGQAVGSRAAAGNASAAADQRPTPFHR